MPKTGGLSRDTTAEPAVAAMAEPLACVLHGLSRCPAPDGDEVVVVGAGPIGLMFVIELAHRGHRVLLGDLVEDRLPAAYEEIPVIAQATYDACVAWAEAKFPLDVPRA